MRGAGGGGGGKRGRRVTLRLQQIKEEEGGGGTDFQMTSIINGQPIAKQSVATVSSLPLDSNP